MLILNPIFIACSPEPDREEDSLVGTWSGNDDEGDVFSISFNSDGSGYIEWNRDYDDFEYETEGSTLYLYMGDEYQTWRYSISGSKLTLRFLGENGRKNKDFKITLTKQDRKSNSKVVGTWSVREGDEQLSLTFKSDGTGVGVSKRYSSYSGTETESGSFTWKMEGDSKGIIIIRETNSYSGYSTYTMYFEIVGSKMYLYNDGYGEDLEWILTKQ